MDRALASRNASVGRHAEQVPRPVRHQKFIRGQELGREMYKGPGPARQAYVRPEGAEGTTHLDRKPVIGRHRLCL